MYACSWLICLQYTNDDDDDVDKGKNDETNLKTQSPPKKRQASPPDPKKPTDPSRVTGLPALNKTLGLGNKFKSRSPGPKADTTTGGTVYVRWGHDSCPDGGAQLVYTGRAGGSHFTHTGGGGNPQCLPLDPEYLKTISGAQSWAYIYGAEYQDTNGLVDDTHDTEVPCAVCYVPTRNALYMIPAKYTCPSGWTREYFGYLMSERHTHQRSQFSCVDHNLKPAIASHRNDDGFLFYTVEGVCGSLPCPPYAHTQDKELSCAVCTK